MAAASADTVAGSPDSERWCWVVAVATFWTNFCLLGVLRSSAVLYVALVDTFHVTREVASWPSGAFGFSMCVTGALAGFVSQYYDVRTVMLMGAMAASLSVSLCSCATEITHIVVLYGAIQGIGVGFIVPLTHVILNQHFLKHRALALGIAYAGSSAGSFVFPPLTYAMMTEYGLQGTFLLLGGIMLNSVLGIALCRRPQRMMHEPRSPTSSCGKKFSVANELRDRAQVSPRRIFRVDSRSLLEKEDPSLKPMIESEARQLSDVKNFAGSDHSSPESLHTVFHQSKKSLLSWSTRNQEIKYTFIIASQVLTHPSFLLISLAFCVYFSASAIFLMVILDVALDKGLSNPQGVLLVSLFSFGDLGGRLVCGWVADLNCLRRKSLVVGYFTTMGIFLMALGLCSTFQAFAAVSVILGVLNGSIIVNFSVLLTEQLGLERLAMAMGFSTFIIGVSAFFRPLVIGYFRDKCQSYELLFLSLGAFQIGISFVWSLESLFRKLRGKKVIVT